jgi:putative protein-disulfide isomerase
MDEGATRPLRRGEVRAGSHVTVRPAPVRVELLTDPWSIWCWGFEPVRRALELRYPSVEFRFLLGGMFPQMPDPRELGFDLVRFFSIVQRTTGMPIRLDGLDQDRPTSTYPACVHVHAVRLVAPDLETRYLRALREAVYLDGRNVSRPEAAADVAAAVGVDRTAFEAEVESGRAEASFRSTIQELHAQGLHAYPTLLVRSGDRQARVEGFQSLPAVLGLVQGVSGRQHPPLPDPSLDAILSPHERVATREVAEVLGVSLERAADTLERARKRGEVRRERHPTGDVWSRTA